MAEYNTTIEGAYKDKAWFKRTKQTINRVQTIVLDNLITENKISKEDVKKYLDTLADDNKNSVPLDQDEAAAKNLQ